MEVKDPVALGLLRQLEKDDQEALRAWTEYRRVYNEWQVAALKYAAVRDVVTQRLKWSPYAEELIGPEEEEFYLPTNGRFRFFNMTPLDAAMQVLSESDEPMTLETLTTKLKSGGIGDSSPSLARSVNASLVNKPEIEYSKGTFLLKKEDFDASP